MAFEYQPPYKQVVNTGPGPVNPQREAREQLAQAETLRQERKFDRAESICAALVRRYPDYYGAQHTLGLICADKGDYRRAAASLSHAAMLNPRSWITQTALAGVYVRLNSHEMAAHTLRQARALKPNEPTILVTLGEIYSEEREYELAREAYRDALAAEAGMEEAATGLARAATALGQYAEAADAIEGLIQRGAPSLDMLHAMTGLPATAMRGNVLGAIEKVVRRPDEEPAEFETGKAFVRAAALDKLGRHAEAWQQALAANLAIAATVKKELAEDLARRAASMKWLRENTVSAKPSAPNDAKQPISLLILGTSRSGKTTMEGLVGRLDGVKRGYENPSVENAISRTYQDAGLLTGYSLDGLPPQLLPQLRENYAEELARRAGPARVFTNTHPGYIHDVAQLAGALPNLRIIFIKRDIDDVVLRIFMRLYKRGNPYSYDLKTAREYVEWYYAMIDLLAEKLPKIVRVIRYEDMVADPAGALRIAAELCGLPMTQAPIPQQGDDRQAAAPYREFMAATLR